MFLPVSCACRASCKQARHFFFISLISVSDYTNGPFRGFWGHLGTGVNTVKITVKLWENLEVRCPIILRKINNILNFFYELYGISSQQKILSSKCERKRSIFPHTAARFYRQLYRKTKTSISDFLARLYPSNLISIFFDLIFSFLNS